MSIDNRIARNRIPYDPFGLQRRRILPLDKYQLNLTQKYILPYRKLIVRDTLELREKLDHVLQKHHGIRQRNDKRVYPRGYCHEINDAFFRALKHLLFDRSKHGFQMILQFIREGGHIGVAWGSDSDKAFQNVIQIGTSILDVARNTLDSNESTSKIAFYSNLHKASVQPFRDFIHLADVMECYWKHDVYPNHYFPWLAPLYPLLSIVDDRWIVIETCAESLIWPNLTTKMRERYYGLSWQFLFDSPYSHRRLPDRAIDHIFSHGSYAYELSQHMPQEFMINSDIQRAEDFFWEFSGPANVDLENILFDRFLNTSDALKVLNDGTIGYMTYT